MSENEVSQFADKWLPFIMDSIAESTAFCMAIFNINGEVEYANNGLAEIKNFSPFEFILNPSLHSLIAETNRPLIFEGMLTVGSVFSVNNQTIVSKIYRIDDDFMIVGEQDIKSLLAQNDVVSTLNKEISNLHRELIKEKNLLKRTLNELSLTSQQLQQSNSTKDKFFSIIAHDLRGSIGGIMNISRTIAEEYDDLRDAEKLDYAVLLSNSSKYLFELLENLLNWANTQRGNIEYFPKFVDIDESIDSVVNLMTNVATQKKIKIISKISINELIYADVNLLRTVIRNLVSNAIKFTNENGTITITVSELNGMLNFSVADTGIGMSAIAISKLFKLDSKFTTKGTHNEKGTGLGLLLCKEFIDVHNGRIWVESQPNIGTTFHFTIPYISQPKEIIPKKVEEEINFNSSILKNLKIMVVEDDSISLKLINNILKEENPKIIIARNGFQAIDMFNENPDIDLIFMDIQMPILNGFEATRQIRKKNKDVIIIAQTAFYLESNISELIEAGFNDLITKPYHKKDFLHKIYQNLKKKTF